MPEDITHMTYPPLQLKTPRCLAKSPLMYPMTQCQFKTNGMPYIPFIVRLKVRYFLCELNVVLR